MKLGVRKEKMSGKFTNPNQAFTQLNRWVLVAIFAAINLVVPYVLLTRFSLRMAVLAVVGITGLLGGFLAFVTVPLRIRQRIKYLSILAIFVVLPFQNTLNLIVGFSIRAGMLVVITLFFIDTIFTLIFLRGKHVQKLNHFEAASLAFMLLAVLYLPGAAAAGSLVGGIQSILQRFQGVFAYFIVRNLPLKEKQVKRLVLVMLIPLVIMVAYAVPEFLWWRYQLIDWLVANSTHSFIQEGGAVGYYRQYWSGSENFRAQSFELTFLALGYSGHMLSSVLLAMVFLSRRWRKKLWPRLALVLAILGTVASATLSSIAIILIAFGMVGLIALQRRGNAKFIWLFAVGFVVIGILAGGIVGQMLFPDQLALIVDRIVHLNIVNRLMVHVGSSESAWRSVSAEVFLIGKGTGVPTMQRYFGLENYIEHEYLGDLIAWGVLGLVVYSLFMLSLFVLIIHVGRHYVWGSLGYALGVGLFCIALGYFLIGFAHPIWGQTSTDVHFMTLLALWTRGYALFKDVESSNQVLDGRRVASA